MIEQTEEGLFLVFLHIESIVKNKKNINLKKINVIKFSKGNSSGPLQSSNHGICGYTILGVNSYGDRAV